VKVVETQSVTYYCSVDGVCHWSWSKPSKIYTEGSASWRLQNKA